MIATDWRYAITSRAVDKFTPKAGRDVFVKHLLSRQEDGVLTNVAKCGLGIRTRVRWCYDISLLNELPRCRRCVTAAKIGL